MKEFVDTFPEFAALVIVALVGALVALMGIGFRILMKRLDVQDSIAAQVEARIGERIDSLAQRITERMDHIDTRMDSLRDWVHTEIVTVRERVARMLREHDGLPPP